jgi:hypothetical protein
MQFERAEDFMGMMPKAMLLSRAFGWIFNGRGHKPELEPAPIKPAAAVTASAESTVEGYDAWLDFLAHRNPHNRKPGMSAHDEYAQWMSARQEAQGTAPSGDPATQN